MMIGQSKWKMLYIAAVFSIRPCVQNLGALRPLTSPAAVFSLTFVVVSQQRSRCSIDSNKDVVQYTTNYSDERIRISPAQALREEQHAK